jgi:hypothetical protein
MGAWGFASAGSAVAIWATLADLLDLLGRISPIAGTS